MKEVEKMKNSKYTKEFRDETVQLILAVINQQCKLQRILE
jgi:hypothetical protein